MKLVQIQKNGKPSLGILTEQGIIDVHAESALKGITMPNDMRAAAKGVPGLLALAEKRGIRVDVGRCWSVCDLCRLVNG